MIIDSTCTLSPMIFQKYNSKLLSLPAPKLRDSSDCIRAMLKTVDEMWYKLANNPKRLERCTALKQEILQLYERAKIKEKEREAEKDHKTQEFGYYVTLRSALDRDVYWRLRFGRKAGSFKTEFRRNHAIRKTQEVRR
jgi:hypothetical protein